MVWRTCGQPPCRAVTVDVNAIEKVDDVCLQDCCGGLAGRGEVGWCGPDDGTAPSCSNDWKK